MGEQSQIFSSKLEYFPHEYLEHFPVFINERNWTQAERKIHIKSHLAKTMTQLLSLHLNSEKPILTHGKHAHMCYLNEDKIEKNSGSSSMDNEPPIQIYLLIDNKSNIQLIRNTIISSFPNMETLNIRVDIDTQSSDTKTYSSVGNPPLQTPSVVQKITVKYDEDVVLDLIVTVEPYENSFCIINNIHCKKEISKAKIKLGDKTVWIPVISLNQLLDNLLTAADSSKDNKNYYLQLLEKAYAIYNNDILDFHTRKRINSIPQRLELIKAILKLERKKENRQNKVTAQNPPPHLASAFTLSSITKEDDSENTDLLEKYGQLLDHLIKKIKSLHLSNIDSTNNRQTETISPKQVITQDQDTIVVSKKDDDAVSPQGNGTSSIISIVNTFDTLKEDWDNGESLIISIVDTFNTLKEYWDKCNDNDLESILTLLDDTEIVYRLDKLIDANLNILYANTKLRTKTYNALDKLIKISGKKMLTLKADKNNPKLLELSQKAFAFHIEKRNMLNKIWLTSRSAENNDKINLPCIIFYKGCFDDWIVTEPNDFNPQNNCCSTRIEKFLPVIVGAYFNDEKKETYNKYPDLMVDTRKFMTKLTKKQYPEILLPHIKLYLSDNNYKRKHSLNSRLGTNKELSQALLEIKEPFSHIPHFLELINLLENNYAFVKAAIIMIHYLNVIYDQQNITITLTNNDFKKMYLPDDLQDKIKKIYDGIPVKPKNPPYNEQCIYFKRELVSAMKQHTIFLNEKLVELIERKQ